MDLDKMTEQEIKQHLRDNLQITISRFDGSYLTVQLELEGELISEDSIEVPNFSIIQDVPEWSR